MTKTINVKEQNEAIKSIESYTKMYKRNRIKTAEYQKAVTENLIKLDSERDYAEYLKNIGQPYPING